MTANYLNSLGVSLTLFFLALSCGESDTTSGLRRVTPGFKQEKDVAPEGEVTVKDAEVSTPDPGVPQEDVPLSLLMPSGSQARFIDARGLSRRYARVFPKNSFGYAHCAQVRPVDITDCTTTIFTPFERVSMGSIELQSDGYVQGVQNLSPAESMTLNYTRTLRVALDRECTSLVTSELTQLTRNNAAANILVKSATPTAADFEAFFKIMMGIKGSNEKVDIAADKYAEAYKQIVGAATDKVQAQRMAFKNICVAIAMDPQVIIY